MTGVLGWDDTVCLGKTGRGDKEEVLPSMSRISWSAWSSTWERMRSSWTAYGSRLKAGQATLQWESATGHQTRSSKWLRPSIGR